MLTRTTSAVLSRRTNSLTLRVRGVGTGTQSQSAFTHTNPRLPLELVEAIIGFAFLTESYPETKFSAIRSFTRASNSFREISLRLYFRDVVIDTRALLVRLWNFLADQKQMFRCSDSFGWVRSLAGPSHIVIRADKNLGSFIKLETLDLDCATVGLSTQNSVVEHLISAFTHSPGRISLKNLTLNEIPCIDAKLLLSLSCTFPRLKTLTLESTRRLDFDCCVVCLEDSLDYTRHSPIPDYCPNAEKLAASFAQSLAPMTKLEKLYLGLYLSDTGLLEDHIAHTDDARGGTGVLRLFHSCAACARVREETQNRERLVSLILSKVLPSLTTIQWDSLFNPLKGEGARTRGYDKDGFYFSNEDDNTQLQVPFVATFAICRELGTGEVYDISPVPEIAKC